MSKDYIKNYNKKHKRKIEILDSKCVLVNSRYLIDLEYNCIFNELEKKRYTYVCL